MKKQKKNLKILKLNSEWSLFLDRDGVINKKLEGDYVRNWEQFEFLPGVIEALKKLRKIFGKIIIVTNQRGIGRGLMTENDLKDIHNNMLKELLKHGIRIDGIYYCPHDYEKEECNCRKPKVGMALQAKKDFSDIDFGKSIMVGDSEVDIQFGRNLEMITVFLGKNRNICNIADYCFDNLYMFTSFLKKLK